MKYLFLGLVAVLSWQCKKTQSQKSTDQIVFGTFYGNCKGEQCVEIFQLKNGELKEDSKDGYPEIVSVYQGDYTIKLDASKAKIAQVLLDSFPMKAAGISNGVIGSPDAVDQGGVYIQIDKGDIHKIWHIDNNLFRVPEELHDYVNKIREVVAKVQ